MAGTSAGAAKAILTKRLKYGSEFFAINGKKGGSNPHGQAKGRSNTPEYRTWNSMKHRCLSPKNKYYKDYGGRGISVCQR